jgi:hypothetical protein
MTEPEIEHFLERLGLALREIGRRERERALREARDHLLCAAGEHESRGRAHDDAVRSAIVAFGAVESIAAGYAPPARTRRETVIAGAVAIATVVLALVIMPPSGRIGQILLATSNAAVSECAGRWNAQPPATGYRLAWVSTPRPACEVVLHDTRHALAFQQNTRAGHWRVVVASISAELRARNYLVGSDGQIGRRVGR